MIFKSWLLTLEVFLILDALLEIFFQSFILRLQMCLINAHLQYRRCQFLHSSRAIFRRLHAFPANVIKIQTRGKKLHLSIDQLKPVFNQWVIYLSMHWKNIIMQWGIWGGGILPLKDVDCKEKGSGIQRDNIHRWWNSIPLCKKTLYGSVCMFWMI